jgi:hypothetical protein
MGLREEFGKASDKRGENVLKKRRGQGIYAVNTPRAADSAAPLPLFHHPAPARAGCSSGFSLRPLPDERKMWAGDEDDDEDEEEE